MRIRSIAHASVAYAADTCRSEIIYSLAAPWNNFTRTLGGYKPQSVVYLVHPACLRPSVPPGPADPHRLRADGQEGGREEAKGEDVGDHLTQRRGRQGESGQVGRIAQCFLQRSKQGGGGRGGGG